MHYFAQCFDWLCFLFHSSLILNIFKKKNFKWNCVSLSVCTCHEQDKDLDKENEHWEKGSEEADNKDDFVTWRYRSGWGLVLHHNGKAAKETVGACYIANCRKRMEIKAITAVVSWLVKQQIHLAVIVTGFRNMSHKIDKGVNPQGVG